ncbi:hypothetical protein Bbelb_282660 [Branchiostoma belcheri]|nr:hypothetical protein Bbelb_282660 [Branchiostoma belcheri]
MAVMLLGPRLDDDVAHHLVGTATPTATTLPREDRLVSPEVQLSQRVGHLPQRESLVKRRHHAPVSGHHPDPVHGSRERGLGLDAEQPGLAIFDVFKAHRNQALLEKLKQHHIHAVSVAAPGLRWGSTRRPEGRTPAEIHHLLRRELHRRAQGRPRLGIRNRGLEAAQDEVLGAMDSIANNTESILRDWERTGIRAAVDKARKTESVTGGNKSLGEGMDAKLEEKTKASKAWNKGFYNRYSLETEVDVWRTRLRAEKYPTCSANPSRLLQFNR